MIPHFKKDLATISRGISRHASPIHWHKSSSDGFFSLPVAVSSWIPSAIHAINLCLTLSLKCLFKQTSRGYSAEVSPPGITSKSVFSDFSERFTCSVLCASKESNNYRLRPPIGPSTFSIQIFMILLCIQPFSWTATTMPCLFWIFGMVLRLKMTSGFNLEPSPVHAKTTVRRFFSFPVVRIFTVFSPIVLTV